MITEFICGAYITTFNEIGGPKWFLKFNNTVMAIIDENGLKFRPLVHMWFSGECLIEIAVLMNNIKRQYKQLQTN